MPEFILPKHFDSAAVEDKWRAVWRDQNLFDSTPRVDAGEGYCILLPPPNVTGTLHMGHAFQHALMDALVRRERMRGRNVLWQAGTDHAGIATQIVVSRDLTARGIDPSSLSREEFLRHVWQWKEQSGGEIANQMRRLGASCDWARERFTMDEKLSEVVGEVFVRLYEDGLIYRGRRLVNWDPVLLTAVSDLEVVSEEEEGVMYYVRYPLVEDKNQFVTVGTTRPETILVDGAVAVNPQDQRYLSLVGKKVWVPLTDPPRAIEIITDDYVEPDFGTGCVKITAAHDFNDYQVQQRHPDKNIPLIILFSPDAKMNDNAPAAYRGLDRFVARRQIVKDLAAAGLLAKEEAHRYKLPRGDRSGAVLEPMLTAQWFMKMEQLAHRALALAARGEVRFVPANWRKVYEQWLENIQDWCLSRQLIWGHQIPAWYDEAGKVYVARNEAEARRQAGGGALRRDADVLDTWFSSALWPFSTMDWPDRQNPYFRHYFPSNVLVTGFDIIFFWVARMVMLTDYLVGGTPFRDVYITGLVRDADGQKMSKSKGNVLDPLDLVDGIGVEELVRKRTSGLFGPSQAAAIAANTRRQYADGIPAFGTDALRFTFASLASYGRDIKFDLPRCAGYRNFCNKLWNATRFVLAMCGDYDAAAPVAPATVADRWIVSRLQRTERAVAAALDVYRFDLAAQAVYQFLWNEYCDWYVEVAKSALRAAPPVRRRTQRTLLLTLEAALRLLHPLMPFITEELWEKVAPLAGAENKPSVMLAQWPQAEDEKIDEAAEQEMTRLMAVVNACRRLRSGAGAPPSARPIVFFAGEELSDSFCEMARTLGGFAQCRVCEELPPQLPQTSAEGVRMAMDLQIDQAHMRKKLAKQLAGIESELSRLSATLANESFVARAPEAVVNDKRRRQAAMQRDMEDIQSQMAAMD